MQQTTVSLVTHVVSAAVWQVHGAHLRYPRATQATIGWDSQHLGSPAAAVDLDVDRRRLRIPYEPVRFAAERHVLWWRGSVLIRDLDDAHGTDESHAARLVVPRSITRHPDGRAEEAEQYLSVEIVDEYRVVRLLLADLQRALWLPPRRIRGLTHARVA